jgi:hypothetical protein
MVLLLPYVVTIEEVRGTVLAIRRNWNPDDELKIKASITLFTMDTFQVLAFTVLV